MRNEAFLHFGQRVPTPLLSNHRLSTMQLNTTRTCNIACKHCHLECGPARTEAMSMEVARACLAYFERYGFDILDLTGGAPEMAPCFRYLVSEGSKLAKKVMVRSNLCVHLLEEYEGYLELIAEHGCEVVSSLPFYQREKADRQRGAGVYDSSIAVLKKLNALGYGRKPEPALNLVYNPGGAFMPGDQAELEALYKAELGKNYGIEFNNLYAFTNMPIGRFRHWLIKSRNYDRYMRKLSDLHNDANLENVMCRDMISVDYDGQLYDCDFNLSLGLKMRGRSLNILDLLSREEDLISDRRIVVADHCFACTAGAGSS